MLTPTKPAPKMSGACMRRRVDAVVSTWSAPVVCARRQPERAPARRRRPAAWRLSVPCYRRLKNTFRPGH